MEVTISLKIITVTEAIPFHDPMIGMPVELIVKIIPKRKAIPSRDYKVPSPDYKVPFPDYKVPSRSAGQRTSHYASESQWLFIFGVNCAKTDLYTDREIRAFLTF